MPRHGAITANQEQDIVAALEETPHASLVARKIGWSFSSVWRVAQRAGIELTAGREAKGYKRLSAAQRAEINRILDSNPGATQQEMACLAGVSRSSIGRALRARRNAGPPIA